MTEAVNAEAMAALAAQVAPVSVAAWDRDRFTEAMPVKL